MKKRPKNQVFKSNHLYECVTVDDKLNPFMLLFLLFLLLIPFIVFIAVASCCC
jgi:hypothetical protein